MTVRFSYCPITHAGHHRFFFGANGLGISEIYVLVPSFFREYSND